jgi:diguanylate cyclase (GGDEF)-like protein/PAS domain S-box-containing protein
MAKPKFPADVAPKLRGRAGGSPAQTPPDLKQIWLTEVQKLTQELAQHKRELNLQNHHLGRTLANLQEALVKYADLYDFAPVGYFIFDPQGLIIDVNLTGSGLLAQERASLIGTPFAAHIAPTFQDRFQRHLEKVFAGHAKQSCTLQLLKSGGRAIQVAMESLALKAPHAADPQCLSIVSDITALQQTVDALRLTQFAVDRASVAIFWVKPSGMFLYANRAACEGLGYSQEELLNMSMWDINPEMSPELWSAHWAELKRLKTTNLQGVHHRKDGSRFPVEVSTNYLEFGGEEFNIAFAMDITKRRQAEEKINTAVTYLENIFASSADPIATVDEHGFFIRWNQAAQQIYGYSPRDLASRKAFDLYADQESLGRLLAQLKQDGFVQGFEIDMKKKDGTIAPFSLSIRLLRDGRGKNLGSVCVARDLTETKQSMEELNSTNAKLRAVVEESDRRNRELTLINSMTEKLQSCVSETEAYPIIGQHAQALFPGKSGALFIQGSANNLLEAVLTWGDELAGDHVFPPGDCSAMRRGRLSLGGDSPTLLPCRHVPRSLPGNYLCLPLLAHDETLGMLHIQGVGGLIQERPELVQTLAVTVGNHISLALANIRLRETLRHQAIHDALTGLFNRRYLEETLEREIFRVRRKGASLGLIMLDLDHFKQFNDSYGHEAGDDLLRALGKFLASRVRQEDVACRYGGEEFVLILPEAASAVVRERAEDIRRGFANQQVFHRDRIIDRVTVSLGVAMFPDNGGTGQDVLRAADDAMYQAKAQGRNRVVVAPAKPS